jgi:hypothetical protein
VGDYEHNLTQLGRDLLFAACVEQAERLGGNERTASYFFARARASRVWLSAEGMVSVADMDIADWCAAIAWAAPGLAASNGENPADAGLNGPRLAITYNAASPPAPLPACLELLAPRKGAAARRRRRRQRSK